MGTTRPMLVLAVVALIGAGCATAPYDPFKIPRDEFYGKIKTIALAPVGVPDDLEDAEPVKATFASLVEAKLRAAGFAAVPAREYAALQKSMAEQVGGLFDPATGRRDEAKVRTIREYVVRELNTKFQADAVLYPSIRSVKATFTQSRAKWDGASEWLAPGGLGGVLFFANEHNSGTVGALSLIVVIRTVQGPDVYAHAGGIQVRSRLSGPKLSGVRDFVPVPRSELFVDEKRNAEAVDIALGSLVRTTAPPR